MGAFITNFQSPVELDDLKDRLDCGGITNLDMILHPEKFSPIEWTVDKEAKIGDVVVFMCAKTSVNHNCASLQTAQRRWRGRIGTRYICGESETKL